MANKYDKEALFEDYVQTAYVVFEKFENAFEIDGIRSKLIGISGNPSLDDLISNEQVMDNVRASSAWLSVSELFDYAINGIVSADNTSHGIVIDGAEILSLLNVKNFKYSSEFEELIFSGDGRHSLDEGGDIEINKLATLANVDIRTVRNAVSADELVSIKVNNEVRIRNASARKWLSSRKGFKPTQILNNFQLELNSIDKAAEFGTFISDQRKKVNIEGGNIKIVTPNLTITNEHISEIESGIFRLPLDTVFPLADFFKIDRKDFLSCVMRVFFGEQYSSLREMIIAK